MFNNVIMLMKGFVQSLVLTWSNSSTVPSDKYTNDSACDGNLGVVSCLDATFSYSSDGGVTWGSSTTTGFGGFYICYGSSKFVSASSYGYIYSTDGGATILGPNLPLGFTSAGTGSIVYGGGKFVALGTGFSHYSTDGITWSSSTSAILTSTATGIVFDGTKYVASNPAGGSFTSTDGITWSAGGSMGITAVSLSYGNGVIVGVDSTGHTVTSTNSGTTWTASVDSTIGNASSIRFGNGLFVIVGSNTKTAQSTDGVTWSTSTASIANCSSVTYVPGVTKFLAFDGTTTTSVFINKVMKATY